MARAETRPGQPRPTPAPTRIPAATVDTDGKLTLRHNSRLHHIGMGRRHAGTTVLILVHDLHVRIITTSGRLLRDSQLDLTRDYQPQGQT